MTTTRSHQRVKAEQKPKPGQNTAISDMKNAVTFVTLPEEVRFLIYEQLIAEDSLFLVCDIRRVSPQPKPPPITRVCKLLRAEALPYYYSRTAILLNVSGTPTSFRDGRKTIAQIAEPPGNCRHLKKVTFFGRALNGQVGITIDFSRRVIIDARWSCYQNARSPNVSHRHFHFGLGELQPFMEALHGSEINTDREASSALEDGAEERSEAAVKAVLEVAGQFFTGFPLGGLMGYARKSAKLNPKEMWKCECQAPVKPGTKQPGI